jgi:hypothetical protein
MVFVLFVTPKSNEETDEESEEVFDNLTTAYFHDFIIQAKHVLFKLFTMPEHYPKYEMKRTEAIIHCYLNGNNRKPVQRALKL